VPLHKQGAWGVDGWVDLADQRARLEIAAFAARLVQELSFDGVHLDVKPVHDGDRSYLLLLDELRIALEPDRLLSAATGYWVSAVISGYLCPLGTCALWVPVPFERTCILRTAGNRFGAITCRLGQQPSPGEKTRQKGLWTSIWS
jgi:hypothetical protein